MSANAYGHTGFTGTSLWIDPDRDMFVVLLTNRVHAARARRPAKVISDVRADLADAAALAVTDSRAGLIAMPARFRADRAVGWNKPERVVRASKSKKVRAAALRSRRAKAKAAKAKKAKSAAAKKKPSARKSR
jgi:CubicO group peptidase (beta-lactamase class C family)